MSAARDTEPEVKCALCGRWMRLSRTRLFWSGGPGGGTYRTCDMRGIRTCDKRRREAIAARTLAS